MRVPFSPLLLALLCAATASALCFNEPCNPCTPVISKRTAWREGEQEWEIERFWTSRVKMSALSLTNLACELRSAPLSLYVSRYLCLLCARYIIGCGWHGAGGWLHTVLNYALEVLNYALAMCCPSPQQMTNTRSRFAPRIFAPSQCHAVPGHRQPPCRCADHCGLRSGRRMGVGG